MRDDAVRERMERWLVGLERVNRGLAMATAAMRRGSEAYDAYEKGKTSK